MTNRHCYVTDVGDAIEKLADALDPERSKPFGVDILDLLEWATKDVLAMRRQLEQAHADIAGLHDQLEEPQIAQDDYRLNKLELEQLRQQLAGWLKANSPGGWIDDLRQQVTLLREFVKLLRDYIPASAVGDTTVQEALTTTEPKP